MRLTRIFKSEFVANVAKLFAGKGITFAITLGSAPIVTRLYDPSDYGVIAVFVSAATLLSILATLKYEGAVVLPQSDDVARVLVQGVFRLTLLCALITLVLVGVVRYAFESVDAIRQLGNYIWWLPLAVVMLAFVRTLNTWLTRNKQFARMASADVLMAATTAGSRIAAGFAYGSTVLWLVLTYLFGGVAFFLTVLPQTRQAFRKVVNFAQPKRAVFVEYAEFPRYTMPADFVRSFSRNMPMLLFGFMFSPAAAGLYYMAHRLIQVPVELFLQAFRGVYLQKIAAMKNAQQPMLPVYLRSLIAMAAIGIIPTVLLFYFGQEILTFVLGKNWTEAGRYAEILAPLLYSYWLSSPAALSLVVLRKQQLWLLTQVVVVISQVLALSYAYTTGQSIIWAIHAYVVVHVVINIVLKLGVYAILARRSEGAVA